MAINDTPWSGRGDNKLYLQSGQFTSTLKTSEDVSGVDNIVTGISWDGINTPFSGDQAKKLYLISGQFTSTLKDSESIGGIEQLLRGISWDGINTPWCGEFGNDTLYLQSGQFSSTLKTSQDVSAFDDFTNGISWDGTNTPFVGASNDKLFLISGQFSSTLKTSQSISTVDTDMLGISWDGTNTPCIGDQNNKLFLISGQFSSTIKTSENINSIDTIPSDISTNSVNERISNTAQGMSFTDTNKLAGRLDGTINITKALSESSLTDYVIYWGSNATTKLNEIPITTLPKTGSNLSHTLSSNIAIPSGATHFLVFTTNGSDEMAIGISLLIVDLGKYNSFNWSNRFIDDKALISGVEFLKIMELQLDSHTIYISSRDVVINGVPYLGIVSQWGDVGSSNEDDSGFEGTESTQIVINNVNIMWPDIRLQDILDVQEPTNRIIKIQEVETSLERMLINVKTFVNLFYGVIEDYSFNNNQLTLNITNLARKIHKQLPKFEITSELWPLATDLEKPYPIIGGFVEKVPIYNIVQDNFLNIYKYIACMIPSGHTIKSDEGDGTFKVYFWRNQIKLPTDEDKDLGKWFEVNVNNYTVASTTDTDGTNIFVITFDINMSGFELSIDIEGIQDDASGTISGSPNALITNHADFAKLLFFHADFLGLTAGDINLNSFIVARHDLQNNYNNEPLLSWWIGERKMSDELFDQLGVAMRRSYPRIGLEEALSGGAQVVSLKIRSLTKASPRMKLDSSNIVTDIVINKRKAVDVINKVIINGDFDHSGKSNTKSKFRKSSEKISAKRIARFKNTNILELDTLTLSNQAALDELAQDILDFETAIIYTATFTMNKEYVNLIKNNIVWLNADNGPGSSRLKFGTNDFVFGDNIKFGQIIGTGWINQRAEVIGIDRQGETANIEVLVL